METRVRGDRAKEISRRLPFDESVHTDTIGYAGGLWLLWQFGKVEVSTLSSTEQEIHAIVKVLNSNLSWLFTTIMLVLGLLKDKFFGKI